MKDSTKTVDGESWKPEFNRQFARKFESEGHKRKHSARRGIGWETCNGQGFPVFTKSQTRLRWRLCKDALASRRFSIKLKGHYEDKLEMYENSSLEFVDHSDFDFKYQQITALGWGGRFKNYLDDSVPEGSFFPFARFTYSSRLLIDTGCIWLGSRSSYPRIFVENSYCKWYFPIGLSGDIIREPFVPFSELKYDMRYLETELAMARFERRRTRE